MKAMKKLLALLALSVLGSTAVEVRAASSARIEGIRSTMAAEADLANCYRCGSTSATKHLCQGCYYSGQSTSGWTACAEGSPGSFCVVLGSPCTLDPCPQ